MNSIFIQMAIVVLSSFISVLPFFGGASLFSIADYPAFSVDLIFLVVLLSLPRIRVFYKLVLSLLALITVIAVDNVKLIFITALIIAIFMLPLHNKICKKIVFCVVSFFLAYAGWMYFLDKGFSLSLQELWNLASFYWWAIIAFFLFPLLQTMFSYIAASRVFLFIKKSAFKIKPLIVIGLITLLFWLINPLSNLFYSPISRVYDVLSENKVRKNPSLNPDIKEKYKVIEEKDFLDYTKPTVMILVETWGVPKDIRLMDAFFDQFSDYPDATMGVFSRVAERTQAAEWEDFHVEKDTFDVPTTIMNFRKQGFKTWYIHGFGARFYHRLTHYPKFGFDSLYYKEEFLEMGLPECNGGFPGICDSAIANWMDSTVLSSDSSFVFWTTLDAHAPYTRKILNTPSSLCLTFGFVSTSEECVFLTHEMETLQTIAALAKKHPEYRFILRGDHRPMNLYCDAKFVNSFYYGWVPIIILND